MDIAKISTTLNQIDITSKVGVKMLDKSMEINEQLGIGLVQMIDAAAMERSINPSIGSNIDMFI